MSGKTKMKSLLQNPCGRRGSRPSIGEGWRFPWISGGSGSTPTVFPGVLKKDDDAMTVAGCKNKLAEVLVFGEQDACCIGSKPDDGRVVRSPMAGGNRYDVVPTVLQGADHAGVTTLVGKESHGDRRLGISGGPKNEFFMGQRIGRIGDGRMNGIRRKLGVGIRQVLDGRSLGQFSKHEFDRKSRPANRRLAEHHERVDADVLLYLHVNSLFRTPVGYNVKSLNT
jgi:hypothetical protein